MSSSAVAPLGTVTGVGLGEDAFVPRHDGVGARRDVVEAIAALGVGHREERMAEHQDERAHVRMDLAEDPHDSRPIEPDRLGPAGGIAAEIERRRLREREHVVVDAIAVRKIDDRAGRDRQHVRRERLVALIHDGVSRLVLLERAARRGFQIHDRLHGIRARWRAPWRRRRTRWDAVPRPAAGRRTSMRPRIDAVGGAHRRESAGPPATGPRRALASRARREPQRTQRTQENPGHREDMGTTLPSVSPQR